VSCNLGNNPCTTRSLRLSSFHSPVSSVGLVMYCYHALQSMLAKCTASDGSLSVICQTCMTLVDIIAQWRRLVVGFCSQPDCCNRPYNAYPTGKFRPHIISDKSLPDRRQCVTICTANQLWTYTIGLSVNTDNNRSSTECENVPANKLRRRDAIAPRC